jgi:dihydroflavonol-4-reductase
LSIAWGFVDVRDVAAAHISAMDTPSAKGRYICSGEVITMREVVAILRECVHSKSAKIPSLGLDSPIGNALIQLMSYTQPPGVGGYLRTHIGRTPKYDNGKIQRDLGLRFRDVRQSIREAVADLVHWGHLPA